jgi:hypothetical protein
MDRQQDRVKRSRRLTTAGLIGVTTGTLLMMAWAIFPGAAFASTQQTTWNGVNGAGFLPCSGGTSLWILAGFGNDAQFVSNVTLTVNGDSGAMTPSGNNFKRDVNGPGTSAANTTAVATWTWDDSQGEPPTPVLTISHCEAGTTTTTTTVPTTTTTTTVPTTTTTTTVPTTTTTTTTTAGGGGTTSVAPTSTTTSPPSIAPTTVHQTKSETESVAPTTVRPGGTAFTGVEDVVPLGVLALTLMTGGSGLLWAGSRRRRNEDDGEE